jgi:hexosaminidase
VSKYVSGIAMIRMRVQYMRWGSCNRRMAMKKRLLGMAVCVFIWGPALLALDSPAAPALKLEPAPKEVQLRNGGFRVGPRTRIFVLLGHQSEDRIAAETLAEEVEDQSGLKLNILGMKPAGKAEDGAIVLARLQDARVRRFLARNGLRADEAVGEDGYLLFSDKSHLIVAANSGEGLFYGVQTLRQLLRPEGKGLICPAVGIRDWPSMQRTTLQGDLSRGLGPEVVKSEFPGPRP